MQTGKVKAQQEEPVIMEKPDICGEIIFDPFEGEYPITLEESLTMVLEKNFDVKIFTEKKNQNKWQFYESVTDWFPDIRYEYFLTRIQGTFLVGGVVPVQVIETPIESNFILNCNISARKYFRLKEALYEYRSQEKELEFTKDEIILRTARDYYDLLKAKLSIEILETNIGQIEEQLRINKRKLEAGVGTKFDVLRAEADLFTAEQQLIAAKNRFRLSQAKLANTLGVPVLIQLVPDNNDVFLNEVFQDCFALKHAKWIAMTNRPDLTAQQFNIEAARQRKNDGYSFYIPEIDVIGQLANQGTANDGFFPSRTLGFLASWNGLDNLGFKGFTQIKARKAKLREEQFKYINKVRKIEEDLVNAYFSTITSRDLIEATRQELKSARESRRLSVLRLESGVGTFIDVLQSQSAYTRARINNLRAIIDYKIQQAQLLFEMGVISANNILNGYKTGSCIPNKNINKAIEYNKKIMEEFKKAKENKLDRKKK